MGAWGMAIFSNDTATDVRGEWREALIAGEDPTAASARIVAAWVGDDEADTDDTEFWTGLAAAQSETGHLQPAVRHGALSVIAGGGDAELYEDGDGESRRRALAKLADRLRGPQPAPKQLRGPRTGPDPGVEVGDVLRICSTDRTRSALFAVTGIHETRRQRWPHLMGLHWEGDGEPTAEELAKAPYLGAVDLTSFDLEDDLPEHFDGASPLTVTIVVARKGDAFDERFGEVIAHGVRRETPDLEHGNMTHWEGLIAGLDGGAHEFYAEATRRRLAEYGDDPRAWERGREKQQRQHVEDMKLVEGLFGDDWHR